MYLENIILNTFDCFFSIAHSFHIIPRLDSFLSHS